MIFRGNGQGTNSLVWNRVRILYPNLVPRLSLLPPFVNVIDMEGRIRKEIETQKLFQVLVSAWVSGKHRAQLSEA